MTEDILVRISAIVLLGVGAQWLAWRLRFSSILFLLIAGFVVGPITGWIEPDELFGELLLPVVSLSVAIILFEGGLSLRFSSLGDAWPVVRRLMTIGVVISGTLTTLAAHYITGLDWGVSALLGAILVVTGPTVITPMLEQIQPSHRVSTALRWEGIVIDPLGAVLAVVVFEAVLGENLQEASLTVITGVVKAIAAGGILGAAAGAIVAFLFGRYMVPDNLQSPFTLAVVIGVFTLSNEIQEESGLVAAVAMGIAVANQRLTPIRHIVQFKESLRVLLLAGLFVTLAARLTSDDLERALGLESLAFLAVMILVVRPVQVAISTLGQPMTLRERIFMAWMAPRGIVAASVASVFALRLTEEGIEDAERLVPLTFLVIVGTIVVYGISAAPLARRLNVAPGRARGVLIVGAHSWARQIALVLNKQGIDVRLLDSNRAKVREALLAGLSARQANVLSEAALDEVDLEGVGVVLSMTPNDEVNSLASQRFHERLGRSSVFQLPPRGAAEQPKEALPQEQRGRFLFDVGATFERIDDLFDSGATVKATSLTEQFDYQSLIAQSPQTLPLFIVDNKTLIPIATDAAPTPKAGQLVISVVLPKNGDNGA